MKYIIQNHEYDCAAVAIFNAIKYYNKRISYKRLSKLRRRLKTGKKIRGTEFRDLKNVLTSIFDIEEIQYFPVNREKVLQHLKHFPIFLQCPSTNGHGHLMFVEKYLSSKNKIVYTNCFKGIRKCKIIAGPMKQIQFCILIKGLKNK